MRNVELTVDTAQPMRIDQYIAIVLDITRSSAAKLIEGNNVLLNDKPVAKKTKVKTGDRLVIAIPDPKPLEIVKQDIPLDVVYEDDWLLVVDKPKGMVVHPAPGNPDGTLVNALLCHCGDSLSGINGVLRPGIVHRIDKNTSGLLVVAKNDAAHTFLSQQIKSRSFVREYEAVVIGNIKSDSGKIDAHIGRHPIKRKQMAVVYKNSKHAVTYYNVIKRYRDYTHVRLKLETGRTHQIRVHMAHIGHPVAGDDVYGPKKNKTGLEGQCLHAKKIGFIHPFTKEYLEFEGPLPGYFTEFLDRISKD